MVSEAQRLREAILEAPLEISNFGETPEPTTLYLPPSHLKALRFDAHVVVGGRGVGKSFWTAALQSTKLRELLGSSMSGIADVDVRAGFTGTEAIEQYPNADVFSTFLDQGRDPYDLWRAVVLRWVADRSGQAIPRENWTDTVDWLKGQPEAAAQLMQQRGDGKGLIVFDALDRTSNVWQRMDDIVRGLLRMILWLRGFPGLHAKVFLREDQAERTVFDFPDASKLMATRADLTWARHDLHGMLWQRLINSPDTHGKCVRDICPHVDQGGVFGLPRDMKAETQVQRETFEKLAGPWMGTDRRRGVPYSWTVSHLTDGRGQVSPRSFLAAISEAAQDALERYPDQPFALHYESIKRGIQKASDIRVREMAEDYPWTQKILGTLRGMNMPSDFETVRARWESEFPDGPQAIDTGHLPAQHADRGWEGARYDLERLGLMETKKDGRIDMPDLYRVGFGLGRKGGVKPRN